MTVAELLGISRQAHRQGRQHAKEHRTAQARDAFQSALAHRLNARSSDPDYTDPSWADDLKSLASRQAFDRDLGQRLYRRAGEPEPEGYDQPSTLTKPGASAFDLIQRMDRELEAYFRHQLGESANTHSQVDLKDAASAVRIPDQWQTENPGVTPCATCQHDAQSHVIDGCVVAVFAAGDVATCECEAYVESICRHTWEAVDLTHRRCVGCGETQALHSKMAIEDTEAFKQLQREQQATGRA